MRILHVVSGDLWAGAEVQVAQLLRALAHDASLEVAAFALNEGELARRLRAAGIRTYCAEESRLGFVSLARRLLAACDEFQPQLLHSHRYKEHVLAMTARLFRPAVGLVRTVHGAPESRIAAHDLRRQLIRALDRWCARGEDACIAVSRDLAGRVAAVLKPPRMEIIPNSVDLEQIERELDAAEAPRSSDREGVQRVGLVGRLVPVKRVDLFLDVVERIAARRREVEFFIVGDGPLRAEIARRVAASGLDQRVHLTGPIQPIAPLMSTLDVLVITSDHEGLPSVLLEALALRVAVVARAVGGIPEVVADENCALLVDAADAGSIAERVERLLGDAQLRRKLTDKGRGVAGSYSSQRAAERHRALYESILLGPRSSHALRSARPVQPS
jgi:L-malate glycosyltransferase